MSFFSSSVGLLVILGEGQVEVLSKWGQRQVPCMASQKRPVKMAQFEPSGSSWDMLAGSCSMVAGEDIS